MEGNLPHHLAIIPDGNRRWARARGLDPWLGHEKGYSRFEEISQATFEKGIKFLTLWGASVDNLTKRSKIEVDFLIRLLTRELRKDQLAENFAKKEVRVQILGDWPKLVLNQDFADAVQTLHKKTSAFTKFFLTILFGYDGKAEMLRAIKQLVENRAVPDDRAIRSALSTGHLPEVDLAIRTGGEPHWSAGFMMWLTADSQYYFTPTLWPDFDASELEKGLLDFQKRERRFGK